MPGSALAARGSDFSLDQPGTHFPSVTEMAPGGAQCSLFSVELGEHTCGQRFLWLPLVFCGLLFL